MTSRGDVVKPESNANEFAIYHRNEKGDPDFRYAPDHVITTCAVKCIKLCQVMQGQMTVRKAFITFAEKYCKYDPKAWFLGGRPSTYKEWENVSIIFLGTIARRFPGVIIDDSVKDPGHLSGTWRLEWDEEFDPSDQFIMLNGPSMHLMAAIAITNANRDHRAFLFKFASALLHELAHVFITYMSKGKHNTPTLGPIQIGYLDSTSSEAGLTLETLVFGGSVEWRLEPGFENIESVCGTPYLFRDNAWYRILESTIDATVNKNFRFPYPTKEQKEGRPPHTRSRGEVYMDIGNPFGHPNWPAILDAPTPSKPLPKVAPQ